MTPATKLIYLAIRSFEKTGRGVREWVAARNQFANPISRTVQQMTRETRMGQPSYTEFRILPRAMNMAIALRRPPKGCIHHTDRGSQYCSHDYQKLMRQHGFKVSMSGKGNCYEFKDGLRSRSDDLGDHLKSLNAAVETFFKTIKAEMLWQRSWKTRRDAEIAIFEYINGFYNPRRRHSALGWKSPLAFEAKAA